MLTTRLRRLHALRITTFGALALLAGLPGPAGAVCPPSQIFGPPVFERVVAGQRKVASADFDRNGIPDLVISTALALEVRLGVVDATGVRHPAGYVLPMSNANDVAIADLDSDGLLDIVATGEAGGAVQLRGNGSAGVGDGTFTQVANYYDIGSAWDAAVRDVSRDGIPDLIVSAHSGIRIFVGTGTAGAGDGGFLPPVRLTSIGFPKGFEVVDLDADGDFDIVTATERAEVTVYRNPNTETPSGVDFPTSERYPVGNGYTYDVCVEDLNADGRPDIASADYLGGSVSVLLQNPDQTFGPAIVHPVAGVPLGIRSADIDVDGLPDLVVAAAGSAATFSVLFNEGASSAFADHLAGASTPYGPARTTFGVTVLDANGDNAPDVVAPGLGDNDLAYFFNACHEGQYPLFTSVVGEGRITRTPFALAYVPGTVVEVGIQPAIGYRFISWSGDASGDANPITMVMDGPRSVVAHLQLESHPLVVSVVGNGTVTRSLNLANYPLNSVVRLTATPAFGQLFAGWTGDVTSPEPVIDVLMDADKNITATFQLDEALYPKILAAADVPEDEGGALTLTWNASSREGYSSDPNQRVDHYWLWREVPLGVYAKWQTQSAGTAETQAPRMLRTLTATRDYFWEFLASVPAEGLPQYTRVIATTNDSTEYGNPYTSFMVQGRNAEDTFWLDSPPDSGYSVDDLAPPEPSQVRVASEAGAHRVTWRPSAAADLESYRVYRGSGDDFMADEATLLAETRDTMLVDRNPGPAHYKVVAVDRHGNRSRPVAAATMGQGEIPFGITRIVPNPARGGIVTVRIVLASDARATVDLLDITGRRIESRTLAGAAGEHDVTLGRQRPVRPGLYWIRVRQSGREHGARVVMMD